MIIRNKANSPIFCTYLDGRPKTDDRSCVFASSRSFSGSSNTMMLLSSTGRSVDIKKLLID